MSAPESAPSVALRYYQEEAIAAVRYEYTAGRSAALVVLATGCGKTFAALSMAAATVARGGRVLWVAHRIELLTQPLDAWRGLAQFSGVGSAGIVQGNADAAGADVVFASTATVGRGATSDDGRLAAIFDAGDRPIRLVVIDECHHYADDQRGMFSALPPAIGSHAARRGWAAPRLLGLTATPVRADGRGLTGLWGDRPSYSYGYDRAIAEGYLVPPRIVLDRIVLDADTARIVAAAREKSGDVDPDAAKALLDAGIVEHTARAMTVHIQGRQAIVFVCALDHARALEPILRADGWSPAVVSGETPPTQRAAILRGFKAGDYNALINCGVLTEGTDLPICDAIVVARPMMSWGLYVQCVGRGLRPYPGKVDCMVLDIMGASEQHDLTTPILLLDGLERPPEPFDGIARRRLTDRIAGGARVHVEPHPALEELDPADEYRWQIVALLVGQGDACRRQILDTPIPVRRPKDVAQPSEGGAQLVDVERKRKRVEAHWLRMDAPTPVYVADVGEAGRVWLAAVGGGWMAFHLPRKARRPVPLGDAPLDPGLARGLGDDLFRQASSLVRRGASWRAGAPSDAQVDACARLGVTPGGITRGDYSDAIATHKGQQYVKRHGTAAFRRALAEHMGEVAKRRARISRRGA